MSNKTKTKLKILKKQNKIFREDLTVLANYVKDRYKENLKTKLFINKEIKETREDLSYIVSQIAKLFLINNNYKKAYILYENVLSRDLESFNRNGDVTEKDFTAFIITSVKLYFCALELTADELEEAETFVKDNLLVFKNILSLEEYEKVLNENLKEYEEMQEIKYLEIFKKLFISTKDLT